MDEINKGTMELPSYGLSGESIENGGDTERGNLDISSQQNAVTNECEMTNGDQKETQVGATEDECGGLLQQYEVDNETQGDMTNEDQKQKRKCTSKLNSHLFGLVVSFCLMTVDQIMDVYSIYSFYKEGRMVFFGLCLVFTVLPALSIHLFVAQRLKPTCSMVPLYFLFAPWILIGRAIHNHLSNIDEGGRKMKENVNYTKVIEGYFEAVPQLFIQMAAWQIFKNQIWFNYVKMALSLFSASFALLSVFTAETRWLYKGVSALPVAVVLGSRAFVCASLFSLPVLQHLSGFLPLVLSVLLAWVTERLSNKETLHRTFIKAVLLPPVDKTGIVASVVFCIGGLVFWLLTLSQPCSVLVFVLVTIIHFLGGLGWKVAEKYRGRCRQDESSCAMPSCICSCLTGSTSGQANIQQEH
ncbi:uncharacterized protein LOC122243321 [Penaeus japonicus]|uniref:uncharacterized protein LOC122243321 n=1 Tax=Penaeus japonicus TaxID=27405 RepID=UPI001C70E8F2|nr:uncharacterized protein LOC122243321 [Penaeus japonicus]